MELTDDDLSTLREWFRAYERDTATNDTDLLKRIEAEMRTRGLPVHSLYL